MVIILLLSPVGLILSSQSSIPSPPLHHLPISPPPKYPPAQPPKSKKAWRTMAIEKLVIIQLNVNTANDANMSDLLHLAMESGAAIVLPQEHRWHPIYYPLPEDIEDFRILGFIPTLQNSKEHVAEQQFLSKTALNATQLNNRYRRSVFDFSRLPTSCTKIYNWLMLHPSPGPRANPCTRYHFWVRNTPHLFERRFQRVSHTMGPFCDPPQP